MNGRRRWLLRMLGLATTALALALALSALRAPNYARTPVVLVHGQGMHAGTFRWMKLALRASGLPAEYIAAIDLVPPDGPNAAAAEQQLAPFVAATLQRADLARQRAGVDVPAHRRVAFVAHSMGSLSTRWFIARVPGGDAAAWISIAGPNHGTNIRCGGAAESGTADICPAFASAGAASPLQWQLNGSADPDRDESPWGLGRDSPSVARVPPTAARHIWYLTLRLPRDKYIEPAESVAVDGAGGRVWSPPRLCGFRSTDGGNFVMRVPGAHDWLLSHPCVIAFVIHALRSMDESRATDSRGAGRGP